MTAVKEPVSAKEYQNTAWNIYNYLIRTSGVLAAKIKQKT